MISATGSVRARRRSGVETPVPTGAPFDFDVDLTGLSYLVPAGHQLVLAVAPSRCGAVENPNSGEPLDAQSSRQVATVDVARPRAARRC